MLTFLIIFQIFKYIFNFLDLTQKQKITKNSNFNTTFLKWHYSEIQNQGVRSKYLLNEQNQSHLFSHRCLRCFLLPIFSEWPFRILSNFSLQRQLCLETNSVSISDWTECGNWIKTSQDEQETIQLPPFDALLVGDNLPSYSSFIHFLI